MVQVIQEALQVPYRLAFTALTQTISREFQDGTAHLTLTDPNTGTSIMVPTSQRTITEENTTIAVF